MQAAHHQIDHLLLAPCRAVCRCGHGLGARRFGQKAADRLLQCGCVDDLEGGSGRLEFVRDGAEVVDMRSIDDGATQLGRLEHVLPAVGDERSADKGDGCHPVELAEEARTIDQIDIRICGDRLVARPSGDCQAGPCQGLGDVVAALGVARGEQGKQPRVCVGEPAMDAADHVLLAAMRAGRDPDRPLADGLLQLDQCAGGRRQRRGRELQVAGDRNVARTQRLQPPGDLGILGEDRPEAGQELAREIRCAAPALSRTLGHARVDQRHRYAGAAGFEQQVRPELGLDPQRRGGLPVVQEPAYPGDPVDGNELVNGPGREPVAHHPRRGHGAGGHQDVQLGRDPQDALDEDENGLRLADARGMNPYDRAGRALDGGDAAPLVDARGFLLAAHEAALEKEFDQRKRGRGGATIQAAGKRGAGPARGRSIPRHPCARSASDASPSAAASWGPGSRNWSRLSRA